MACAKGFDNLRFDADSSHFDKFNAVDGGRFFYTSDKEMWDSRSISVCHVGVDTVKQLYKGMVKTELFAFVQKAYDDGEKLIKIDGYTWKLGSGRWGGYRYSLNNPDYGVLVLFGSFYTDSIFEGDHLKIELSPHFILGKKLDDLQDCIDEFADIFIHLRTYTGVAVHLCVDVQGWQPPNDFDSRLVTRASRIRKFSGDSDVHFEQHAIAKVYGQGETFTFGSVSSLQFSVYNKSKLIAKNENVREYWHSVYAARCVVEGEDFQDVDDDKPVFKKDVDVWRIEPRFHHSVVSQFAMALNEDFRSFKQLGKHLTGLWHYALTNFRFDSSFTYVHPVWQFLRDDVEFNHDKNSLVYRRIYKKTDFDTPPSDRVLKIVFGLLCSCYRRLKYSFEDACDKFFSSGIGSPLIAMFVRNNAWCSVYYTDEKGQIHESEDGYSCFDAEADIRDLIKAKLFPPEPLTFFESVVS